jgi:endonuclease/exonuclease/phosphatase family metal-dependent hydrolase
VARILRGTHADLFALQEVLDVAALKTLCREMNRLSQGETDFDYRSKQGQELLTPPGEREMNQRLGLIYDRKVLEIPRMQVLEQLSEDKGLIRAPLLVHVQVRGSDLDFDLVNLHLKAGMLAQWARERRTVEVQRLVQWWRTGRPGEDPDLLFIGDFNSSEGDETTLALDQLTLEKNGKPGEFVAIEGQLNGELRGTHIPWDVGIDRALMSRSMWKAAGLKQTAWVYRFDDFMPGGHLVEDFCMRSRWAVRDPQRRCDCDDKKVPEANAKNVGDWAGRCTNGADHWVKAANHMRISDHRPLLWDIQPPSLGHSRRRRGRFKREPRQLGKQRRSRGSKRVE